MSTAEAVAEFSCAQGRKYWLIAESSLNDARVIRPPELGGYGLDAQWSDDFHHSLRTLLTDERQGYYADFGQVAHLVKAFQEGFVYTGEHSVYRQRRHGNSSADRPGEQFVVCAQNHDQVGNRLRGERLSQLVCFEALKLAAGALFVAPNIPLLFMGEEYGEESPFLYFVSHGDPDLIAAVRAGRQAEFAAFNWPGEPPDPQDPETFLQSKLRWERRREGRHQALLTFYQRLTELRRKIPALRHLDKRNLEVSGSEQDRLIWLHRWHQASRIFAVLNFHPAARTFRAALPSGVWSKVMDSADERWQGPGASVPKSLEPEQEAEITLSFAWYEQEPAL
jgi:maltooligosyltrehalose trehalohydrolase